MIWLRAWHERLANWQEVPKNRWILTVLVSVCAVASFGPLCWSSYKYSELRTRIGSVLSEANIEERNQVAVQLLERGTVTVDGVEIGGVRVQAVADQMFARDGLIGDVAFASSFIASSASPGWAPANIIEQPLVVICISILALSLALLAVWLGNSIALFALIAITGGLMGIFWTTSQLDLVLASAGIGFLIFSFLLLTRVALIFLGSPIQIFAVANTLILEAIRQRISIGFIGALLIVLPLIPLGIDSRDPLRYQLQTFISRGTSLVFLVAACLTLFLSCSTVAFEIRDKQIWNILTKPVSRFQYLAGKLLGLTVLNGIVLVVGSFAVFVFVQLMSTRAPIDNQDAAAVRNQVLVAREVARPQYKLIDPEKLRETVNGSIQNDSILRGEIADGIKSESDVARQIRSQKTTEFMTAQRLVNAGESEEFIFSGLAEARRAAAQPVLRYCFHMGRDTTHELYPVLMKFGDLQPIQVNFVPVQKNIVEIPVKAIQEDGTLVVTLVNAGVTRDGQIYPGEGSFNFDADGIEVLHRVGGFEGNFFRAVLIDWGKLIFIAALGVGSASILSFPVAVLLSCTIFIVGSMSTFLSVALDNYSISTDANVFAQFFQYIIRAIVQFVWWALKPFSSSSSADLIDGQVIPWKLVFVSIAQVGIGWSVAVFSLCLLAFKKKEIAIYSGGDG